MTKQTIESSWDTGADAIRRSTRVRIYGGVATWLSTLTQMPSDVWWNAFNSLREYIGTEVNPVWDQVREDHEAIR